MTIIQTDPSQAQARKRRKQILASNKTVKRTRTIPAITVIVGSEEGSTRTTSSPECSPLTTKRKKVCNAKVIKSNTKYQNRYEPDVPMSKEEEAEWRKEARRQRNRESAAASRNKVRNRIQELETEVEDWKTKYESLMRRIEILEKDTNTTTALPTLPNLMTSQQQVQVSPLSSPQIAPKAIYVPSSISLSKGEEQYDLSVPIIPDCASSSSSSNETSSSTTTTNKQFNTVQNVTQKNVDLHVIENTSRPAASR